MARMVRQSLVKFDAPLCETIIDTPKPQGREVLVRIERCGLCHSDLHIQDGYADLGGGKRLDTTRGMTLPFTLGHEIAGVVDEVGPDVSKDLIGKKKAVFPWIGCGQCRDCLNGDENLCVKQRFLGRLHRRRLCHPRAGARRKISAGLRSAAGQPGGDADVFRHNGLWRAEAAGRPSAAAQSAADRPRRRRHDGAFLRAGDVQAEDHGRRSLCRAAREAALQNGAAVAYDPAEPDVIKRILKETEGGFDGVVDFAGNEKSMAFAVAVVARGGKIVVSGLMGGNFSLPMVQWVYKRMTIEGFMVGTLAEGQELMALARAGKIKPTPMKEEPMADVQKWIDELRAGKVVGRIVLKN